jgi:hypothetical protein
MEANSCSALMKTHRLLKYLLDKDAILYQFMWAFGGLLNAQISSKPPRKQIINKKVICFTHRHNKKGIK